MKKPDTQSVSPDPASSITYGKCSTETSSTHLKKEENCQITLDNLAEAVKNANKQQKEESRDETSRTHGGQK